MSYRAYAKYANTTGKQGKISRKKRPTTTVIASVVATKAIHSHQVSRHKLDKGFMPSSLFGGCVPGKGDPAGDFPPRRHRRRRAVSRFGLPRVAPW